MAKKSKQKRIAYATGEKLNVKPIVISAVLVFVLLTGLMVTFMIFMLPKSVESIAFREQEINIQPGQTIKPEVIILPDDAAKRDYRITTSNPAICSVTPFNEIRGENKGEVTITATLVANESLFATVKVFVIDTTTITGAEIIPQNIKTNQEIDLNGIQIFEGNSALPTTVDITPIAGRVLVSVNVFKFETAGERKITFQAFDSSSIRRTYSYTIRVYNEVHITINESKSAKFSAITAAETTPQLAQALGITVVDDFNVALDCQISITDDATQQVIQREAIAIGNTYTIEVTATDVVGNTATKTFEHVAVYGVPTVSFSTEATVPLREDMLAGEVDFYDVDGEYTLDINQDKFASIDEAYFGISGIDSFNKKIESTGIKLTKPTFVVAGNDRYQMTLTVTDMAGNSVSTPIKLRVFDMPKISCKPEFGDLLTATSAYAHISYYVYKDANVQDYLIAQLGLKVTDYFGSEDVRNTLSLAFEHEEAQAGDIVKLTITATDKLGNTRDITINCKIYGEPTISYGGDMSDLNAISINKTQQNAFDALTDIIENISGEDSFGEELSLSIIVKDSQGQVVAFESFDELVMGDYTIKFNVIDRAGNMAALENNTPTDEIPLFIYGNPIIEYTGATEVHVKLADVQSKNDAEIATVLAITAEDCLDRDITNSLTLVIKQHATSTTLTSSQIVADSSTIYTFTFTATDSQGNTASLELTVKVYNAPAISNGSGTTSHNLKLSDINGKTGSELANAFGLSAQDTYGVGLAITLDTITESGDDEVIGSTSLIEAGKTYDLLFSASDLAAHKSTVTITVRVYDAIDIETAGGSTEFDLKLIEICNKTDLELINLLGLAVEDSFENGLPISLDSFKDSDGDDTDTTQVVAGGTYTLVFSATDDASNTDSVTITVKVYGTPTLTVPVDTLDITQIDVTIADLKGRILDLVTEAKDSFEEDLTAIIVDEENVFNGLTVTENDEFIELTSDDLTVTIKVTDAAGNEVDQQITITFTPSPPSP